MSSSGDPWYLDPALLVGVGGALLALGGTVWAAGIRSRGRRAKIMLDTEILANLPPDADRATRDLLLHSVEADIRALVDPDGSRTILRIRWLVLGLVAVSTVALFAYAAVRLPAQMDEWTGSDRGVVLLVGTTFAGLVIIAAIQLSRIQASRRHRGDVDA